jgi:uncharacterized protein (DUF1697 family)
LRRDISPDVFVKKGMDMTILVSLLRGVNVGGYKKLKMSDLAELYVSLGFTAVRTYVQSGNVVFLVDNRDIKSVAKRIEKELKTRLNLEVNVFVRTRSELAKLVDKDPFKKNEPNRVHVTFLSAKPDKIPTDKIRAVRGHGELFSIQNREVFLFLPNGQGKTKLSNSFFERILNVRATTRNWNTVTALLNMAEQSPPGP